MIVAATLAYSLQARALDPQCSFDSLSLCKAYDTDSAKIDYPDGTFFPNLRTLASPANVNVAAESQQDIDRSNARVDAVTARSLQALTLLNSIKPAVSQAFAYQTSGHLYELKDLMDGKDVYIPWPPTGASKVQRVTKDQSALFLKSMTDDQRKELSKLVADDASDTVAAVSRIPGTISPAGRQLIEETTTFTKQRLEHVKALVDEVKKEVEAVIRNGRADAALSAQEKTELKKVQLISLNTDFDAVKVAPACLGLNPNAFYQAGTHNLSLCPNIMNYPDASLAMTIGHEIGHSIDPCFGQFGVNKLDRDRLKSLQNTDSVRADNSKFRAVTTALKSSFQDSSPLTAFNLRMQLSPNQQSYLESTGAMTRLTDDVPFNDYVFKDVYQCLMSPRGGSFRGRSASQVKESIEKIIAERKDLQGANYNAEADRKTLTAALDESPECVFDDYSQMQEVVADWIGQSVQAQYLKAHGLTRPQTTPKDRLALIGLLGSTGCPSRLPSPADPTLEPTAIDVINRAQVALGAANDVHPSSVKRANELALRDPTLRVALGCSAQSKEPPCEHKTSVAQTSPAGTRNTNSTKGVK